MVILSIYISREITLVLKKITFLLFFSFNKKGNYISIISIITISINNNKNNIEILSFLIKNNNYNTLQ
jgi:hypothetical protein